MNKIERGIRRHISDYELDILKFLKSSRQISSESQTVDLSLISQSCGIEDSDDVLRALYALEGKSLVSPEPAGDFTSSQWRITEIGIRALEIQ